MNNIVTGGMVYIVIWWIVLFMVLPWGVQTVEAEDLGKGHATSAPKAPKIVTKMAITTVIAAILWGVGYWIDASNLISFR